MRCSRRRRRDAPRLNLPLYFIHVKDGTELTRDEEGSHLVNLDAARFEAIDGARQLISEAVLSGRPLRLRREMQIDDANGRTLLNIPFRDAIDAGDEF